MVSPGESGGTIRPVSIFHRYLHRLAEVSNRAARVLAIQGYDHLGVQVGNLDPKMPSKMSSVQCYGLARGKDGVEVEYEKFDVSPYKQAKNWFFQEHHGKTSLSDKQIKDIAERLIKKHGGYVLVGNDCRKWAAEFFNAICDVEGSKWIRVTEGILKVPTKKEAWMAAGGVAALAVAGAALNNYLEDKKKKDDDD